MLRMPVATVSERVAATTAAASAGVGLPPIQTVPNPRPSSSASASVIALRPASSTRDACSAPLQIPTRPKVPPVPEVSEVMV